METRIKEFRSLQDKTQVMTLSRRDFVHPRLTHSLEESVVGRSLGCQVGQRILERHPHLQNIHGFQIHEIIVKDYDDSTKEHHIEIHFRIPIINDKIHLEKNKDGSISRDKKGLRKYKVLEGEGSLNNPLTHQKLFDGNRFRQISWLINVLLQLNGDMIR